MRAPVFLLAALSIGVPPTPAAVDTPVAVGTPTAVDTRAAVGTEDGIRLAERVASPLAFLTVAGGDSERSAFAALEQDPAAAMVWSSFFDDRTTAALGQLRELAALSTGEVEFALNALLPRDQGPALPILICRVRLSDDGATSLRGALDEGQLGSRSEDVAGRPTWLLVDPKSAASADRVPAFRRGAAEFRIALAGRDLLASNSKSSLEDVLLGALPGATTTVHPDSIAANNVFTAQRRQLGDVSAAHVLHIDWSRVRARVFEGIGDAPRVALQALGLGDSDHVTVALRSAPEGLRTSVLIDQPRGPDGLLAFAVPTSARKILANLPPLSLAGMTLSIDPARLRELAQGGQGAARASGFVGELIERCAVCGIDFADQVLPRLNGAGSAQLVLLDDDASAQGVAFSVGAKSQAAARSLLGDVRAAFESRRDWRMPPPGPERRRDHDDGHEHDHPPHLAAPDRLVRAEKDLLTFAGALGESSLGVVGADLVFSSSGETIRRMGELSRRNARERQRARQRTQELCDRIVAARAPVSRNAIGVVEIDGSILADGGDPKSGGGRHAGLLFLEEGTLRVELVSPR